MKLRASSLERDRPLGGQSLRDLDRRERRRRASHGLLPHPELRRHRLTLAVGIILVADGAPRVLRKTRAGGEARSSPIVILAAGAALFARIPTRTRPTRSAGSSSRRQSPYGEIRVVERYEIPLPPHRRRRSTRRSTRRSISTRSCRTSTSSTSRRAISTSRESSSSSGSAEARSRSTTPRTDWKVDAVEIDPLVIEVADGLLRLRLDRGAGLHDGRPAVSAPRRRDLRRHRHRRIRIELDPLPSRHEGGLRRSRPSRLAPDGILVLNVQAIGWHDTIVRSLAATLETQFPERARAPDRRAARSARKRDPFRLAQIPRSPRGAARPDRPASRPSTTAPTRGTTASSPITRGVPFSPTTATASTSGRRPINVRERKELHEIVRESGT